MPIKNFAHTQRLVKNVVGQKCESALVDLNQQLFDAVVRPYLHWDIQQGRAALGWMSQSLEGIMWLMVMLDFLGPGEILKCPRCHNLFITTSNRMKYCSKPCYGNFKVQKYQKKKKEEKIAAQRRGKAQDHKSTGKKK